jgi:hypothetical protein
MNIEPKQLKGKPRKIGKLDDAEVFEAETKGGLYIVMAKSGKNGLKTLGTGSHRAVARNIAEREHPSLRITELSKSESMDAEALRAELPAALVLTRRIQALE